jgi:hypothetical protein
LIITSPVCVDLAHWESYMITAEYCGYLQRAYIKHGRGSALTFG